MSWAKRNLSLVIGGAIALLLMGVAGWYNYAQLSRDSSLSEELDQAKSKYKELWTLKVFPGEENVKLAEADKARLESLKKELRKYFKPIEYKEGLRPIELSKLVQATINDLIEKAEAKDILVSSNNFYFSFTAPAATTLADNQAINHTSRQLADVKALSEILIDSQIKGIVDLKRVAVSTEDNESPMKNTQDYLPPAQKIVTNSLAVVAPYEVTFTCMSESLANVLNRIAESQHGIVVQYLGFTNKAAGIAVSMHMDAPINRVADLIAHYETQYAAQRFGGRGGRLQQNQNQNQNQAPAFNLNNIVPRRTNAAAAPRGGIVVPSESSKPPANAPREYLRQTELTVTMKIQVVRLN